MKRTIAIILMTLLIVSSTLVFVACSGGVKTEQQWNNAMDILKTSNTVTVSFEKKEYTNLHIEEKNDVFTVTYNATLGTLHAVQVIKNYKVGVLGNTNHHQIYVVCDGADIKYYIKDFVNSDYKNWEATLKTCASEEDALLELQHLFWGYLTDFRIDNLRYNDFSRKLNKFEKTETVGKSNILQQVTFSDGKLSKFYYESNPKKDSDSIDHTKITVTVQYIAESTTPNGLSEAIWK